MKGGHAIKAIHRTAIEQLPCIGMKTISDTEAQHHGTVQGERRSDQRHIQPPPQLVRVLCPDMDRQGQNARGPDKSGPARRAMMMVDQSVMITPVAVNASSFVGSVIFSISSLLLPASSA